MSISGRYVCNLPPHLLRIARDEVNEPATDEQRLYAIDQLRTAFDQRKFGKLRSNDDIFFLKFLRAKKFDQRRALQMLQNYHQLSERREIFDLVQNPGQIRPLVDHNITYRLRGLAENGSVVTLTRWGLVPGVGIEKLMALSLVSLEQLLEDERVQICGVTAINDLDNFDLSATLKMPLAKLFGLYSIWFDTMPIRIRMISIVNEGRLFYALLSICKWFMARSVVDKVKHHGKNYRKLQDYVPAEAIPPYLAGKGLEPATGAVEFHQLLSKRLYGGERARSGGEPSRSSLSLRASRSGQGQRPWSR